MLQPETQNDRTKTPEIETLEFINQSKQFLNKEFLTWLWFFAENHTGPLQVERQGAFPSLQENDHKTKKSKGKNLTFYVWIDDRLILESHIRSTAQSHQNVFKGGDPSQSPEASVALLGGKVVKELKLGCKILPYGDFSAILSGSDLNPRSLTLPKRSDNESADSSANKTGPSNHQDDADSDPLNQRLVMMRSFTLVLDHLVTIFIKERIKSDYESETAPKIRQWIRNRRETGKQNSDQTVVH